MKVILTESNFNEAAFRKWKKDNITYRGVKNVGQPNNEYGADALGEGLYSVPKKPKVFNTLNDWEIWMQYNLLKPYNFSRRRFEAETTIRAEMLKLGYDGVIIKGREMVNYTPEDVKYFANDRQLIDFFENNINYD